MKWLLPVLAIGGIAAGGFYLFAMPEGRRMLESIKAGIGGYDDPFKYATEENADAWDPSSKMYKDIQKRIWSKKADAKSKATKKIQKDYIEAYLADAF